jgi:callose synthase
MEEALKMRNLLQEFLKKPDGVRNPSILGLREHIFTGRCVILCVCYFLQMYFTVIMITEFSFIAWCSVSSLAWFMSNQETSFVTIGQRLLANPLK